MDVFVTSAILLKGQRIDPGPEPVELEPKEYLNLRKAGCVESAEERKIRLDAAARAKVIADSAQAELAAQLASVEQAATVDAASAAALADSQAQAEAQADASARKRKS